MIKTRSWGVRAAVVAGAMALLIGAGTAQAATQRVYFTLSGGTITLGALGTVDIPASPTSALDGQWDAATGEFSGSLAVDPIPITDPIPATAFLLAGPVTGTVPADGSPGSVSVNLTIRLEALGQVCLLELGALQLETLLDANSGILLAGNDSFNIPAVGDNGGACSLASTINGLVPLPLQGAALELELTAAEPPPEPTPPAPEPTPEPTPEAAPATPAFTG
jgi:hypothetical protein